MFIHCSPIMFNPFFTDFHPLFTYILLMVIDHGHAMVVSVHGTSVCLRQADQKHRIAQALLADAFRWMRSTGGSRTWESLPGTLNNPIFLMETTPFLCNDLVHHPIETTIKKLGCLEFQVAGNNRVVLPY